MNDQKVDMPVAQDAKPIRIWGLQCPFNKHGVPVVGSFGSSIGTVVIFRVADWTRLCKEIPELASRKFEVGTYDSE